MKRSLGTPVAEQSTNMLSCLILLSLFTPSDTACTKVDLSIQTPQKMEALSGSCLHIPCSFTATGRLDSTRGIDGLWSFGDTSGFKTIYNSNGRIRDYPMNITGDLAKKNCTTLFSSLKKSYSGKYEFRIENANVFKASACSTRLQIQVKESAPSPEFHVPLNLIENKTVIITCSAPVPCPGSLPILTWNLQGYAQNKLEQNRDGTITAKIQQNITLSEHKDGNYISCSATYPVAGGTQRAVTKETLSVSYAPKNTSASVSPSAPVSAGSTVTLNCSSKAKPPITTFTWFRRSEERDSLEYKGSVFTFNITEGGVYYCMASNQIGNQVSQLIQLTLLEPDASVQLLPILGGILGFIALAALLFFVWRYKSTSQEESQTEDLVVSEDQKEKGEIHYGEIDFSRQRASTSAQPAEEPQTVYAEVRMPDKTRGSARAPAVSNDDIYAQVRKN